MKLRIRGNTLRLRLTRAEIDRLAQEGHVADSISFGPGSLTYAIQVAEEPALRAAYQGSLIEVVVPRSMAQRWLTTEAVGVEGAQPVDGGETLRILVEKDFACLKPRSGEDDSDAFPHPAAG
jgi:hypothetical protein